MTDVNISENLRTRIIDKVARVLIKSHTDSNKHRYYKSTDRLNFACPYCGDSTKNTNKKRGNLYWNDLYFHCYNCGEHRSLDDFLKDHQSNFEGEDRISIVNYIKDNQKSFNHGQTLSFHLFDKIKDLALTRDEVLNGFNAYNINEKSYRVYPYLKSRLLHTQLENFAWDPRKKDLYVFNFDTNRNIIGFQIRSLSNRPGPKYRTFTLSKMYERLSMNMNVPEEYTENFNKISMLFGILSVDMSRTFTIFEGPIDSMFMYNSIGNTGVDKHIINFDDIPTVRYFYDNDSAGKSNMIEKLKNGQSVFMWSKYLDDYKLRSTKKTPLKDLNDLIKYEYKNKAGLLTKLDDYFTNDHYDIIYL